ncbi:MAG: RpiR family transcriptional regulator [Dehalococcoidia bacterium]
MVIRRGNTSYVVEVKAAPEGRSDRLIPLWSQACLQVAQLGAGEHRPIAVVAAPRIPARTAKQILGFATTYSPDVAVGVIDFAGLRRFRGPELDGLDSDAPVTHSIDRSLRGQPTDLFTDLNQWLLKVLLAPELPEHLLSAPREKYQNASQLAKAAKVSAMTAYRLVQQLEEEGYLHESDPNLKLVRRDDLFRRWQASAARRVREAPMRFVLRGKPEIELKRMLKRGRGCLGLFAAAEALNLGFVDGVPPHVYVKRLGSASVGAWKNLIPVNAGEAPDVILREAAAPKSVFRGVVKVNAVPVSDILQIWIDVHAHPARGKEQADMIRQRVLKTLFKREAANG